MKDMTSTPAPNNNLDRIFPVRGETGQNIFVNKLTASSTCAYSGQPTWRSCVRVAYVWSAFFQILTFLNLTIHFFKFSIFRYICRCILRNFQFYGKFVSAFSENFSFLNDSSVHFLKILFFCQICQSIFRNFQFFEKFVSLFLKFANF